MGANFTQNALPYVGAALQLEGGDASGLTDLLNKQAQQKQQAAQKQALSGLLGQEGYTPEQQALLGQLPLDQMVQVSNSRRQAETSKIVNAERVKSGQRADEQLGVAKGQLTVRQQELADKRAKDAEQKKLIDQQVTDLQPHISMLGPADQVRANALLTTAKKTGDFSKISSFLAPEKPKEGTPAHLFQQAALGEIDINNPKAVDNYFLGTAKTAVEKAAARAKAENFKGVHYNMPPDTRKFYEFYEDAPKPVLNEAAKARLKGLSQTAPQAPASTGPAPTDMIRIERNGQTGTILRKDLKPTDKVL